SGLLGILVAGAALLAVARETKPLSLLARELDKLGTRSRPILIPERGATEVRTLIRAVNAMQERIAALIGNRTLVLGALSHDLRTHLTRLRLRIELLPAGKERERAIADVEGMFALFEDTLDFAQMSFGESGAGTDLGELLERRVVERGDGGAIHLHDMETLPRLAVNETAMARLVDNLIENALRYGGEASLSASHDEGWVVLRVEDRGPGIPPEERDRVFEPFVRLDPSRNRESGGTGLGLTIVKQVVDTHGGQITLADREGGGLSVTVRLPVLAAH
ncbi:MAG TPA: ATP-binding protein, partial [Ancylobacter sp.]